MVLFYTSAILLLYYGLSLYLRSSVHCHLGSNTSTRDACLRCDANYVHLPTTTGSVWIQRTCHQPPSGCRLPQGVASFSNRLPRLPSELDVIIVRKEITDQSHQDFHVRRNVVHRALQWLVMHNKYYLANNVCIDGNALDQLPEGGNLAQLRVITIDFPTTDSPTSTASTTTSSSAYITSTSLDDAILTCNFGLVDEPYDSYTCSAHLPQSFFLTVMRSMSEQEAVMKSVEERQFSSSPLPSSSTLMWPSIGGIPINDLGYFTCVFPTLFPTGAADFSGRRPNQVNIDRIKSP